MILKLRGICWKLHVFEVFVGEAQVSTIQIFYTPVKISKKKKIDGVKVVGTEYLFIYVPGAIKCFLCVIFGVGQSLSVYGRRPNFKVLMILSIWEWVSTLVGAVW